MTQKLRLREPFQKQHGKRAEPLLKSGWQHLYHIRWSLPSQLVLKSLSFSHAKSWDCLLTHWLQMKCILFVIETISRYQFRCNYLRNKKLFLNFLVHFCNLPELLKILNKKMTRIDFAFPKFRIPKTWSDKF